MGGMLEINTLGQGLYEITSQVVAAVKTTKVTEGLSYVFVRHTSASLTIQQNADPSAKSDLESWLSRFIPEDDPLYTHTLEG